MEFLNNKYARILTILLLLQAVAFYAVARRPEAVPNVGPLANFPTQIADWRMVEDLPLEKEVQDVLRADDTMNRRYLNSTGSGSVYFFIAFFKTQRTGQSPHSPKNCLPGAGWEQITADRPLVKVPDWPIDIKINRYVVEHGLEKSVVLYWYQSHNRVIANEFAAKFWLVADAIRYHRSDTALVKVVIPVRNDDVEAATATGISFTQEVFPSVVRQLPL
jgi:EpsI family protein